MNHYKRILTTAVAVCILCLSPDITRAGESAEPLHRLRQAKHRLLAGVPFVKPGQAMRLRAKAKKLETMIDEIEAGRSVDEAMVDRALRDTLQNF